MNTRKLLAITLLIGSPIALLGSAEMDRKIEDAARGSYNFRTVLENQVKATASNGIVTLTGTVQDRDDKELAQDTVENLPGVTSVKNDLEIKPAAPEHSDEWIAWKIRGKLLVKANVSPINTVVAVKDGLVTLTGTAENAAQKELTGIYAKEIDGVMTVRNELVVSELTPTGRTLSEKIDDASITSQVKFALLRSPGTSAMKTKVTTTEGVVTVTGEAGSDAEKALVSKLATGIRGVKSVTNNMAVKN